MFTGIIETTAMILEKTPNGLVIERPSIFDDIKIGSSISVAGACLSITAFNNHSMSFSVVAETWAKTNLGSLMPGRSVNLERAMLATSRLEGHIVQGHVEGVGVVTSPPLPPSPSGGGGTEKCENITTHGLHRTILQHARHMRSHPTRSEAILWESLRNKQMLNLTARRQFPIGKRILDFYFHVPRLGIEIDGPIHQDPMHQEFDKDREDGLIARYGIHIIRFTNEEVEQSLEKVLQSIKDKILSLHTPPPSLLGGGGARGGEVAIRLTSALLPFVVSKGSIAIDGVSLTVASIEHNICTIALIPLTLSATTLGTLKAGDHVNIETDVFARMLRKT